MTPAEPLALYHSWPLADAGLRLDLGWLHDGDPVVVPFVPRGAGRWSCDLADDRLDWSEDVFDLFGFPRDARPTRADTVARYREESRAAMERLRAHAIRHRRGFTLDVAIRPATGGDRWLRLTAAPVCAGNRVVRLAGLKQDVTAAYR